MTTRTDDKNRRQEQTTKTDARMSAYVYQPSVATRNMPYTFNATEHFTSYDKYIITIIMSYLLKHRIGRTEMAEYASYSQIYIIKPPHHTEGDLYQHFNIKFICDIPRKCSSVKHVYFKNDEGRYTFMSMTEKIPDSVATKSYNDFEINKKEEKISNIQKQIEELLLLKKIEEDRQNQLIDQQLLQKKKEEELKVLYFMKAELLSKLVDIDSVIQAKINEK